MARTKDGRPANFPHNRDTLRALANRLREAARQVDEAADALSDAGGESFIYVGNHAQVDDGAQAAEWLCIDASKKISQRKFSKMGDVEDRSGKEFWEGKVLPLIREGQAVHEARGMSGKKPPKTSQNGNSRRNAN